MGYELFVKELRGELNVCGEFNDSLAGESGNMGSKTNKMKNGIIAEYRRRICNYISSKRNKVSVIPPRNVILKKVISF
jgi:hypothetical protein